MKVKITGRRTANGIAGIIVLVLLSISGRATAAPATGSRLVIGDNVSSMFATPLYDDANSAWSSLLFSQLTQVNNQGIVVPQLLAYLPSTVNGGIRAHGTQLLLTLKSHRTWSNGAEITAADVVFGWRVARLADRGQYCAATGCRTILSVRRQDKYHVLITLRHPYSPLLTDGLPPVVLHSWPAFGGDPRRAEAVMASVPYSRISYYRIPYPTSGPYKLDSIQRLVSRDHGAGSAPFFQRLALYPYGHITDAVQASPDQQPDVIEDQNGADLGTLLHNHGQYHLDVTQSFSVFNLQLNAGDRTYLGDPNPMRDVRVRQALALALDRRKLTSDAFGIPLTVAERLVAYTPFVETSKVQEIGMHRSIRGAWDPLARRYIKYGPLARRDARQLLREAGYPAGLHIDVLGAAFGSFHPTTRFNEFIKSWARIGVETSLKPNLVTLLCGESPPRTGKFEAFLDPVITGPDPDVLRAHLTSSKASRVAQEGYQCHTVNVSGTQDRVLDRYLREGVRTYDPVSRRTLYAQVERRVTQQAYWIPLWYQPHLVLYQPGINGVRAYPAVDIGRFANYAWNVNTWRRAH